MAEQDSAVGRLGPPASVGTAAERAYEEALERYDDCSDDERERVETRVATLFEVLERTHAMAVCAAFAFADGPLRFSDLEARLDVAPSTLSARLTELTDAGLLERTAHDEVPPRVEYEPTETARALFPAVAHFYRWASDYELNGA